MEIRLVNRMATQARGETSLKIVLIIGLTLLNGATVGLLGWLFWQDGVLAGMVGIGLVAIQCGVQQFLHCREHISDRQRIEETEAALRLSEQQLKVALQASKLGSWQLDLKTNEFSSSEQCKTNFGLSPDSDLSYGQLIEQIHPDDRANVQESLQRAIEQHTDYEAEHRIILADGAIRWILSRGAAIYEPDVSPSQLFGVSLDITDRKHVEAELRQSQRFTEQVTNDSPQLLYIFDLTTQRNVYVNRQIATILGYTLEQLEQEGAQFFANRLHPDEQLTFQEYLDTWATAVEGQVIEIEYRMRHANGYWHWLRSREVVFTRDANGRPTQVLGTAIDITAEKRLKAAHEQAEATLIDSEARLRAIFNQAAVGIAQTDPSGRFLRVNRWLCDLLGYTPAELLERTVNDITYLCGQEAIPSGMQALLAGEVHDCSFEKRYVCRDGQLRWVNVTISVVRNEQGTPQYFIGVVEDIEQRKQAEAALHESEATNRALLEAIPDLMIRLTRDGTYLNFIPAKDFEILLPDPQLPGKSIYEVMPLAFAQQRMYYVEHAFRSGKTQVYEYELMINGTLRHQEARITVSGTHEALVIVRDITKRKQTEDALYDSEERWQLAIQGNNDGIWDWSLKTGKLFYSTRCREMLGYADPEIEDSFEGWSNLTHPDDLDRVMTALRAYLDRQIPTYMIEYRLRSKDGSYRWVLSRAQALWDEDGSPLRIVGSRSDITDRKNAEDALREKEEQLRLAIDFTQLGTWDWRIPPDQLLWNENTARLLDLPADRLEVTSQDWIDRLHPEDRDWVLEISERALKNRTIYEAEYRVIWNDDSIHWVLGKGHGVYDEAGQVVRMVGVIMDISDRKYAEEALRQSEAQLRTLVENLPFDCWVCDADGRYIIQNLSAIQNWGNMIGYTKAEAGIPGNIRERWQSNEALALAGEVVLDEVQYTSRDQTRTVFSILAPVRDGDMIRGIVGVSIDITARKQAEEALRESEARFRQLAENIQEVFFIYSPDYSQLFYVSPALQKLWGLPPEQLYQNPHLWMDFIHPDDRDHILSQLPSRIEQEYTAEYRLVRSDGEVRWTHIRAFPVQNTQGEIYRIVGLFEDITDRKQSEMMLQQAKDAAEAANRAKSEFLSRMSHELRTPLTAILGFAELIATDSALSQDNQENLAIISRNGTHLLTLINDVLEMSKIEVGKITLDETSFNLYHLIDTVEELLRFKAIAKGLELRIERSINVPQYIQTDKTKLRQVLFNLLDNAIKFTNAGYVILRVRQGDREMRETQDPSPPSPHPIPPSLPHLRD